MFSSINVSVNSSSLFLFDLHEYSILRASCFVMRAISDHSLGVALVVFNAQGCWEYVEGKPATFSLYIVEVNGSLHVSAIHC